MLNIFKKLKVLGKKEIDSKEPQAFIFTGRSGCGKGTQADLIVKYLDNLDHNYDTLHIESGSLLRGFAANKGFTQQKIKAVLDSGILVPESIIVSLWSNYLINHFTGKEDLVFDGTPRKLHEAKLLDNALQFYDIKKPVVLCINVSHDWSLKRLQGRARKDDTPEAIDRRLAWYETEVTKTIEFYKSNPYYNFIEINGEQPIDDVHHEILAKLGLNL